VATQEETTPVHVRKTPGVWKGEKVTEYYDLICFGSVAEHGAESLLKGMRVVAVGRAEIQRWTDPSGEPRESNRIVCDELSPSLRWAQGLCCIERRVCSGRLIRWPRLARLRRSVVPVPA
jgi:Single-strand binding protein family